MNIKMSQHIPTTIASMSSLKLDAKGVYHSIISSFYTDNLDFDVQFFLEHMKTLGIKRSIIYNITKEDTITHRNKHGETLHSELIVYQMNYNEFFTQEHLKFLFIDNKEDMKNIIFIFSNFKYIEIQSRFKILNINISGGANAKKHLLSPLHFRLSLFLSCISDAMYHDITDSFHHSPREHTITKFDLTSKNVLEDFEEYHTKKGELNSPFSSKSHIQKREYHTSVSSPTEISPHFSFHLKSIHEIIHNNNLNNNKEAQQQIESSWVSVIKDLHENPNFISSKYSFALQHKLLEANKTLNLIYESGKLKRKFPSLYFCLNKIELLMLTFVISMTGITLELGYTNLCGIVGRKIMHYIYLNNKTEIIHHLNSMNDVKLTSLSKSEFIKQIEETDIILLGDFYLEILMNFPTDIFERTFDNKEGYLKNEPARLIINPIHFEDIKDNLIIDPASLPMVCEPNKWSDNSYGGYLDNKLREEGIISGSTYHGHEMVNKENLYLSINLMSSIQFGINKDLLQFLESEGHYLIEEKVEHSEELQRITSLQVAHTYKDTPYYLPLQSDWRGRLYTIPFFIDYQGNDLSLSLLEFWEGKTLTQSGLDSLYIYGANNYNQSNINKDTYSKRIKWVKDNIDQIIKMDKEFIIKAENKITFSAFCLVIRELHKDPHYKVKLPVFLDATCSGIQHLAAIMKDFKLASEVNLVPQDDSIKVSDIYNKLRVPINEAIRKYGKENPEYSSLEWVDLKRKDLKLPIMTKTYNVTQRGIKDQLTSIFTKTKIGEMEYYLVPSLMRNKKVELTNNELIKMAGIINKTIFKEYPSLNLIYTYFIEMAKFMNKLELPIIWFTPSGLEITQRYYTSKRHKMAINFVGKTKKMVIKEWTDKVDKRKQSSSIIPNIIHSLDASHLMNVILSADKIKIHPVITVHDCFGTHPNTLNILSDVVKLEFIKLYTDSNFLEKFHSRNLQNVEDNGLKILKDQVTNMEYVLLKRTKLYIPNIPKLGDLNLNNIIYSKYMIT